MALIFPFYGLISFIHKDAQKAFSFPLLIFFIFFGILFVVPEIGDASRHFESFQSYTFMSWSQFTVEIWDVIILKSTSYSDFYVLSSNFFISRISNSSSVFFGFHALLFGLVFLFLFKLLFSEIKYQEDWISYTIFLTLFFVISIAKIQYIRFFLATLFFFYGCYLYLIKGNTKFWFYFLVAGLVHVSLFIPSVLFFVFIRLKYKVVFWIFLAVISLFSSNYLSQYSNDFINVTTIYSEGSRIESMSKAYIGNEDYILERANRFDDRRWFTRYSMYMANALSFLSIMFFLCIQLKKTTLPDNLIPIFTFSLLLLSLSNFGNAFASVGERFLNLFIFSSLYFSYLLYPYLSMKMKRLLFIPSFPFLLLFIAMSLREVISVANLFTLIGFSYLVPIYLSDPISIYDFIFR